MSKVIPIVIVFQLFYGLVLAKPTDSTIISDSVTHTISAREFMNEVNSNENEVETLRWDEYLTSGYKNEDPYVRVAYYLLSVFFVLFITIFFFIILNRFIVEYFKRKKKSMVVEIEGLIAEYLSLDVETEKKEVQSIVSRLNTHKKNKIADRLILRYILKIDKSFSGSIDSHIRDLYVALNYHKKAIRNLNSENWGVRAKAIRELAQMDRVEATNQIKLSLNHINPVLRLEAGIALLKLDKDQPFALLGVNRELTLWQQVNLFEIVRNGIAGNVPSFKTYLNAKQSSIVVFSIKLIEYFQQLDALDELVKLIKNANESIRLQVVETLGVLESEESVEAIINHFEFEENNSIRLACIKSLGKLNTPETLAVLLRILSSSNSEEVLHAAIAIRDTGQMGKRVLENEVSLSEIGTIKYKALQHALDSNLVI